MSSSIRPWSSSTGGSGPGLTTGSSQSFTSCRIERRDGGDTVPWLVLGGRTSVSGHRQRGPLQLRDDPQGGRSPPRAQPSRTRCRPGRRPSGRGLLGNRLAARARAAGPLRVLSIANVLPGKGLCVLIDALSQLPTESWRLQIDCTLTMAGPTSIACGVSSLAPVSLPTCAWWARCRTLGSRST